MAASAVVYAHIRHCQRRNLRPATIQKRLLIVGRLETYLARQRKTLLRATLEDLRVFTDRPTQGPGARANEVSHIRAFYRWCLEEELIKRDPSMRLERPQVLPGLPRPIGDAELARALDCSVGLRVRPWLYLAAYAGLRAAEIAWLPHENVRLRTEPAVLLIEGKGGRVRSVPVNPILGEVLTKECGGRRGRIFTRWDGGPLQPHSVSHEGNRHLHDLGIPDTFHSLRHWFGTKVYAATHDLLLVQQLMGHSNPATTKRYAWIDPDGAVDAVNRLPVL